MYWIVVMLLFLILWAFPERERFQEMFGFSGYKKPITDTSLDYSSMGADMTKFSEVTDSEGVTFDEMNTVITAVQKFLREKFDFCVYPIETSKIEKFKHNETTSVLYKCKFMFMVTSSTYPFVLGVQAEVLDGKVVRASTQDMHKSTVGGESGDLMQYNEIESFTVYNR